MNSTVLMVVYIAFLVALMIFAVWGPARKDKKKKQELMNSLAVGDYVLTTSGMYGKVIDITSDMVIVEFGGKNCRIPMLKDAITSIEKPDAITDGISDDGKNAANKNN